MSFIHEARLLVCFYCYGVWSAKTTLKVCDTSISMISFYKLTFFGFDCGFISSSRAMWDMVTAESGSKLYQVKNNKLKFWRQDKPFHFWTALTILLKIRRDFQNLTKLGFQWRKTKKQSIKYALRLGSLMKMSNGRLKVLSTWFIFLERLENVN